MKLLLDTHISLSVLNVLERDISLPNQFRFAQKTDQFIVSVASFWEIAIKHRLGKLSLNVDLGQLPALAHATDIAVISISASHALASIYPEPPTRDPFDRILLAQCKTEGMRLVTIDRALIDHPLAFQAI